MALTRMTVLLDAPPAMRDCSFVTGRREACAGVDLGVNDGELAIYGAPDALRRLAAALVVSADAAETLAMRGTGSLAPVHEAA